MGGRVRYLVVGGHVLCVFYFIVFYLLYYCIIVLL